MDVLVALTVPNVCNEPQAVNSSSTHCSAWMIKATSTSSPRSKCLMAMPLTVTTCAQEVAQTHRNTKQGRFTRLGSCNQGACMQGHYQWSPLRIVTSHAARHAHLHNTHQQSSMRYSQAMPTGAGTHRGCDAQECEQQSRSKQPGHMVMARSELVPHPACMQHQIVCDLNPAELSLNMPACC